MLGGQGTVIDLGHAHGFKTGDTVVYGNGGAASIGGLNDGQTYYVLQSDTTTVTLAETLGGNAVDLTSQGGDVTSQSLRLALDPSVATGTGHRFFEPDDVNDAFAVVSSATGGAAFFAYASVVDNGTNDPIFVPGR